MESGVYGDTRTVVSRTIVFYFLSSPSCHALDGRNETNDIYIYIDLERVETARVLPRWKEACFAIFN